MGQLPLSGCRIVDLSRVLAGPVCTMLLGDLGADVIKVERPGQGDETRTWGPPFDESGRSAYFLSVNRNKLSVALDLAAKRDVVLVRRLISDADVVVDNFLPGVLERLGLPPDDLLARHERLIWCSVGGFPESAARPGYDFVIQAEAGWMAITGEPDGEPMKAGIALADVLAGRDAAVAVLAALWGRDRGLLVERRVRVTLAASARAALVNVAQNTMVSGDDARRWGNAHANLVPYQLFPASDRNIVIAVGSDEQWRAAADVLGLPDLARDDALATNRGRLVQRARIVSAIGRAVSTRPAAEWITALSARGVPCGVVKSVSEAIADAAGASALDGMPSSVGGATRRPPPALDEHGDLVRSAGWNAFR